MNAPIIFCHYGNKKYLPSVFKAAKLTNPDKEIILLGDTSNQWLGETKNVTHLNFEDYDYGPEIDTFNKVYRLVQGKEHSHMKGGRDWVNFVFKRWFFIHNLIQSKGYKNFWHFDSDTMVLESLSQHEDKFQSYDCTEQCNGSCLNGFIPKVSTVARYIEKINELFQDEVFMQNQQDEFDKNNPKHAYTEMRAYEEFKESGLNAIRLNTILGGSSFDDCICQNHEMEMEPLPNGKLIKKIYIDTDGAFYCKNISDNTPIKMNTLNLSWVSNDLFLIVLSILNGRKNSPAPNHPIDLSNMHSLCGEYFRKKPFKYLHKKIKAALKN